MSSSTSSASPETAANDTGPNAFSPGLKLYLTCLFVFLGAFSSIDRSILAIMVDDVKRDLHLSDFQMGVVQGLAFMLFYSTIGLVIGAAVDRFARRPIIYMGVTIWSLAAGGVGLATNFIQLFVARAMVGFGESSLGPAVASIASDTFSPKRLSSVMSIYASGGVLGTGLAIGLGGWLLTNMPNWQVHFPAPLDTTAPWRLVLFATGFPGLILAFLAFSFPEPKRRPDKVSGQAPTWRQFGSFFKEQRSLLIRIILGYSFLSMGSFQVILWAPAYAQRVLGMGPAEVGGILGLIIVIGGLTATVTAGFLCDALYARGRRDASLLVASVCGLVAVPLIVLAFTSNNPVFFFVGAGATVMLIQSQFGPALAAIQMVATPRMRGRTTAVQLMAFNLIGVALGPMATGALTDFVYRDDAKVGLSIVTLSAIMIPTGVALLWSVRRTFAARAQIIETLQSESSGDRT